MNTIEKIQWTFIMMSAIAIIMFWVSGFNNRLDISLTSLIFAGISAWVAILCLIINEIRKRNYCY